MNGNSNVYLFHLCDGCFAILQEGEIFHGEMSLYFLKLLCTNQILENKYRKLFSVIFSRSQPNIWKVFSLPENIFTWKYFTLKKRSTLIWVLIMYVIRTYISKLFLKKIYEKAKKLLNFFIIFSIFNKIFLKMDK